MQQKTSEYTKIWSDFQTAVSKPRMAPFIHPQDADEIDAIGRYCWNMALCEALYPSLHTLEVLLRNAVHDALARSKQQDDWYNIPNLLRVTEQTKIHNAKQELSRRNKPHEPDRIVAELTFGFWTSLFVHYYDRSLVIPILSQAFPSLTARQRTRRFISPILDDLRFLRNRVFHHEPVWYWNDLEKKHRQILEVIGWISPGTLRLLAINDQFKEVYRCGWQGYRDAIKGELDTQSTQQAALQQSP